MTGKNLFFTRKYFPRFFFVAALIVAASSGVVGQFVSAAPTDKKARADVLLNEAMRLSQWQGAESQKSAIEKLTEARKLFQEIDLKPAEAWCLFLLGQLHQTAGDKTKAIDFYRQSLAINHAPGGAPLLEANTLAMLGLLYSAAGEKAQALEADGQAVALYRSSGDKKSEAVTTTSVCMALRFLDEKQKALDCNNKLLPLYREIGDKFGEGLTLNDIGAIYSDLGDAPKALENLTLALTVRESIGDQTGRIKTLINLGALYDNTGDKPKASEYYNQSLALARASGDKADEGIVLTNIGKIYKDTGDGQKAIDFHNQALTIFRAAGDKINEAKALNNIGETFAEMGEPGKAFDFENRALAIFRAIGDKHDEAVTLLNVGGIYEQLGEKQSALDAFTTALPIFKAKGDARGESAALNSIGAIYLGWAENQKAVEYFLQALPLRQKTDDKAGEAATLSNLGSVYAGKNDLTKAGDYFIKSLALEISIKDKRGEAVSLNNLGDVFARAGKRREAVEQFYKALLLSKTTGDRRGEAETLSNLMLVCNGAGNRRQAIFFGKQSANLIQELRSSAQNFDKETQKIFLKSVESTYRNLTEFLLFEKRLPEARQTLDAFKDQQFFDLNSAAQKPPAPLALTPREAGFAARYEQTSSAVGAIESRSDELKRRIGFQQPGAEDAAQIQKLESDLKIASDEFTAVFKQTEIEFARPADEQDKAGKIPDFNEMQNTLRRLSQSTGQRAVAVYQLVGEENLHLLLITPDDKEPKQVVVPIKNADLQKRALEFWALLQSDRYDPTKLGGELYDIVFKPIEPLLPKDTKTILWSLDGNLRYVPMAALYDDEKKQYLVERYNHVNFTRADAERMTRAVSAKWTGTRFGTSEKHTVSLLGKTFDFNDLPGVKTELQTIFTTKGASECIVADNCFLDAAFNKRAMIDALKMKRPVAHIASHFAFRAGDEARSFLLLGDGSPFTLAEMKEQKDMFAGVEMLTLSACNTAAQQAGNGREVDAFFELAQRLGANAVMATLWSVADNSTPALMKEFYDLKLNKHLSKAEALRQAQLSLLKNTTNAKPAMTRGNSSPIQIVVAKTPEDKRQQTEKTRSDIVYLVEEDAPVWDKLKHAPFAHPFYWSPFVLIGNWR